jgi:hypothetical protein
MAGAVRLLLVTILAALFAIIWSPVNNGVSARIVRLPLWLGLETELEFVVDRVTVDARALAGFAAGPGQ